MPDFNEIFDEIGKQIITIAESTVSKYRDDAIQDANELVAEMKEDLTRWLELLAEQKMKVNEFEWLVNSTKEMATMMALQKAGLAAIRIEQFASTVRNVIIDIALKRVVGNMVIPGGFA